MAGSASVLWWAAGLIGLATVAPALDRAIDGRDASHGFAIPRAPDGQYYATGRSGATSFRLLVDPGAATVLLSAADARSLGFSPTAHFTPVRLETLAVGPYRLKGVDAVIAPDLPVSLLGRSYLDRLRGFEMQRDQLLLR